MDRKELGKLITLYRKKYPLTQEQLAEKAGMSRARIGQIERGEANMEYDNLKKIALALDCDLHVKFIRNKE